jgi:hypothetical protein
MTSIRKSPSINNRFEGLLSRTGYGICYNAINMEDKSHNFIKKEILQNERRIYLGSILTVTIGYFLISLWLNAIRATAPIFFVWVLIIIQFTLYFLIFITSYNRSKVLGWKRFAFPLFVALAILGRVNDWEIIVIPLLAITMLIFSFKTKNVSDKMRHLLND